MRETFAGLMTGLLFGLGLCLSGMTNPAVVQGFLDIAGDWNPALIFVMAAGVVVTFFGYRLLVPKSRPLWAPGFSLPAARAIDTPLLSGAAIFGVGWGLAGYCPGPAMVSLASGRPAVFVFVLAMLLGMIFMRWIRSGGWATMKREPADRSMTADARTLLRESPLTAFQIAVVAITTALNMIDGFDVLAISFTAPVIAKEWGVNPATLGVLLSAGLAGMALGSLTLSPLADIWGRRAVVFLSTAIISVGMLGSAATSTVWELAGLRFVTGLGVGGLLASGNTLLAEYSNDKWRDLSISFMVVGYSGGAIVGGSIAAYLIAAFGWRAAFIFGGACSTVLLPAVLYLPESIDFILARGGNDTLTRVNAVMRRLGHPPMTALPQVTRDEVSTRAVIGVFEPRFLKGTLLICLCYFTLMLSFYFVLSWTPKNLVDLGFTVQQGIFGSVLLNVGGIFGGLAFGYFAARSHARKLAPYMFVALFASIVGFGALRSGLAPVMTGAFIAGFFLIGSMTSLYALVPQIYPARVRNTGTGLAIGFGRLGAVVGPYLGGLLIGAGWQRLAYYSVLALPVLISAVAVRHIPLFGERAQEEKTPRGHETLRPAE